MRGFVMQQHYGANVECETYVRLSMYRKGGGRLAARYLHVVCMHERGRGSLCRLGWDGCNFVHCVSETITASECPIDGSRRSKTLSVCRLRRQFAQLTACKRKCVPDV